MPRRFDVLGHAFVLITLLLTVYGQLILKWQLDRAGPAPDDGVAKLGFLLGQLLNPWIASGLAAAFLASIAWMAAMTRFELGYAYPFMSLAFVVVMAFGVLVLGEALSLAKIGGTALVVIGLVIIARG